MQKVNSELVERYFQFLRNTKKIGHNTACKYLAFVKTILLLCINERLIKPNPFYGLKITSKPVFKEVLTQEEIDKITSLKLDDLDLVENPRALTPLSPRPFKANFLWRDGVKTTGFSNISTKTINWLSRERKLSQRLSPH